MLPYQSSVYGATVTKHKIGPYMVWVKRHSYFYFKFNNNNKRDCLEVKRNLNPMFWPVSLTVFRNSRRKNLKVDVFALQVYFKTHCDMYSYKYVSKRKEFLVKMRDERYCMSNCFIILLYSCIDYISFL